LVSYKADLLLVLAKISIADKLMIHNSYSLTRKYLIVEICKCKQEKYNIQNTI
jgi:hypothetical protein